MLLKLSHSIKGVSIFLNLESKLLLFCSDPWHLLPDELTQVKTDFQQLLVGLTIIYVIIINNLSPQTQ